MTRSRFRWLLPLAALLTACSSGGSTSSTPDTGTVGQTPAGIAVAQPPIVVTVGTATFTATLADTETARAFAERMPLTLDMVDVNGNEKAFELAAALPPDATSPGAVRRGDLMLYGSDTVVLFYESFDTSYAYTRIGRLHAPDGLADVLGAGDVTVTFDRSP